MQLWFDHELEALHFGIYPEASREELKALVHGSTVELGQEERREAHAGDFARWKRRGGTAWFSLLARRR